MAIDPCENPHRIFRRCRGGMREAVESGNPSKIEYEKWWTRGLLFEILPTCRTKRSRAALIRECNAIVGICIAESTDSKDLEDRSAEAMPSADADGSSAASSEESSTSGQDSMSEQAAGTPDPSAGGLKFDGTFHDSGSDEKSKSADKTPENPKSGFFRAGFSALGDVVADEDPVIKFDGTKDYEAGQKVKDEVAPKEGAALIALAAAAGVGAAGVAAGAIKTAELIEKGIEVAGKILDANGGMTFATPNGPALVGAMDAAPAAAGVGAAATQIPAAITTAIAADDMSQDLSVSRKGDGKGATRKAQNTEKSQAPERKSDTPEMRNNFVKSKVESKEWIKRKGLVDGRPTWHNSDKSQYFQKTVEKSEIEVYNHEGEHIGVIKPSDGILRTDLRVEGRKIDLK